MKKKRFFLEKKVKKNRNIFFPENRRGQIWVETVVYTLIALVLIGLVLAFAKPKIEEIQDKGLIEQSIEVLNDIDYVIKTLGEPGNQRLIMLSINKGTLTVDSQNDKIFFKLESRYQYSEPGQNVNSGEVIVRTEEIGKINEVTLTRNYVGQYDVTFRNAQELGSINRASTPYRLLITNKGPNALGQTIINIEVN